MIYLKTDEEIELLRENNILVSETLAEVGRHIRPGVTTKELDRIAEEFIRSHGAVPAFLGYEGYPASLCISVNEQVVRRNMAKIRENGITALVFATPSGALAGMRAIQETGLKIPDNISLIACRDCEYTELLFPALTVIDHDFTEMCRLSVDIIRGGNRPRDREIQLPMRLIKRESIRQLN